jgi:glucose-6-phosphate isomerase
MFMLLYVFKNKSKQGFIWDINSFDQMGVELGKTLATDIRTQMKAAREEDATPQHLNPSTTAMLKVCPGC